MRKAGQKTETKTPSVEIVGKVQVQDAPWLANLTSGQRESISRLQRFEIHLKEVEEDIAYMEERLKDQRKAVISLQADITEEKKRTEGLEELLETQANSALEGLAKLPWVAKVTYRNGNIIVDTVKGALTTVLDTRIVEFPAGSDHVEFVQPTTVPMPTYRMVLNLRNAGEQITDNHYLFSLTLSDESESEGVVWPENTRFRREQHAHWASSGTHGYGQVEGLCLGDAETDGQEALKAGIVPFFQFIAQYLQSSLDGAAYRTKEKWAMWLARPDYLPLVWRRAKSRESAAKLQEKYKEEYKKRRQPRDARPAEVNSGIPGGAGSVLAGTAPMGFVDFAREMRRWDRQAGDIVTLIDPFDDPL